jgi:hypothetical protein
VDSPLLLALTALPLVVAALIVVVSGARRRRRTARTGATERVHRLQSDSAAVQDAVVRPPAARRRIRSGRERRGSSAD